MAHGCPIAAIEAAFGLQRRTVRGWVEAAGHHCEQIHEHLVLKPRESLANVQADELRVKAQGSIVWLAMAIMVSTRLWLGGAISPGHAAPHGLVGGMTTVGIWLRLGGWGEAVE